MQLVLIPSLLLFMLCCAMLCCAVQSFKDHLKLPLSGIPGARGPNSTRSYGDSDAASSLRSGPGGKPSSMWSFLRGATGR
jgi:hypothetical protein